MALAADWAILVTAVVVCWLELLASLEQQKPLRLLELPEMLALWTTTTTVRWRLPEKVGLPVERATSRISRLQRMRDSAAAHVRNACVPRPENS